MKKTIQHSVIALVIATALFLPQANRVQAASWHAPSGWRWWTIAPVCRNGVKITVRINPPDPQAPVAPTSFYFVANRSLVRATTQPKKSMGNPTLSQQYGTIEVLVKRQRTPLAWTVDETGEQGISYIYGIGKLKWAAELPVGTPVIVRWDNGSGQPFYYFLGSVRNCLLP